MARVYVSAAKRTQLYGPRIASEDYWVLAAVVSFAILEIKI